MKMFLPNLTAALLILHAMIGCCHCAGHCEPECETVALLAAAPCQACDHCHNEPPRGGERPFAPCDCELACHGLSTYLPTPKTVIDSSSTDSAVDFAAALPALLNSQLTASLPWDRAQIRNESPPPLRLHLMHQMLLI